MRSLLSPAVVLVCSFLTAQLGAAEFQGADALLKRLTEAQAAAPAAKPSANPVAELRQKLVAFRGAAAGHAPEEAARQWLALLEAFWALPSEALAAIYSSREQLNEQAFLQALPPTASWDALATALDRRPDDGQAWRGATLRVLAAALREDAAARRTAVEELGKKIGSMKMETWERENLSPQVETLTEWVLTETGNKAEQVALFTRRLAAWEKKKDRGGGLTVPALARLASGTEAAALLRRVVLSGEDFSIEDEATRKIAAQVALKNIAQLKKAQWRLVRTVEDAPLYEALAKQFSKEDGEAEHERRSADAAYLVALIANNRVADAAKFITERREQVIDSGSLLGSDMTTELVRRGLIRQVHGVLRELLQTDAALPFWEDFIELSARLGESDKALAFLRAVAARPNLSPDARRATSRHYAAALLAADEVEEGLKVLREIIQAGPRSGAGDEKSALADLRAQYAKLGVKLSPQDLAQFERFAKQSADTGLSAYLDSCLQLARLGRLLARPEMAEEGVAAAQKALATANAADSDRLHGMEKVAKFLVEQGHGAAAEALASEELARVSKAPMSPQQSYQRGSTQAELLRLLTAIYHRSDRPADVLRLLDAAPWWQAADLAQLVYQSELEVPLGFAGAKALAAAGKKDEARSVVRRVIEHQPGYDPAYRLLLELGGDDLEAWLDTVAQRDRFEERPLIWKARLQLDAGRIDAAEKSVRAAIAIDPSDGEQGKDERMRAYAVLGDILEKKGDAAQAKIMRGAVAAIRLSEKADDWWSAGLLTRAVKMYEEALGHFADAYCIQSRLALRYSELGDYARAEQHYVRAYELMPESFGRIESHCFGCERAFSGERAQGIAERVFTQLATKLPDKAQVFYLLGYLRQEQERPVEAATAFRQAVKLDPDYFNAWEKLHELRDEGVLSAQEIDVAAFAQLRLDPARRHGSISFEGVRDLRGLWNAVLAAETAQPPIASAPLYPLAAAKAERDRRAQAARTARGEEGANDVEDDAMAAGRDRETLRAQFIRHPLLENVAYFLTATKSLQSMRGF